MSDNTTISILEQTITEKNLKLTKMKQKIAIMNSSHKIEIQKILMKNSDEINALLQKCDEMENSSRKNFDSYQTKCIRLCKQIERMETGITAKEAFLKKIECESEVIQQSFELIEQKVAKLEQDILNKDKIVDQQGCEIFELQQSLEKKSAEVDNCSKNLLEAHQKLLNFHVESEQSEAILTNELLQLSEKVQIACKSAVEKQKMLCSLETENDQIKQELLTLKNKFEEVEKITADFKGNNENQISLKEELSQMVVKLEAEACELGSLLKQKELLLIVKMDVETENRSLRHIIDDKDKYIDDINREKLEILQDKDETIKMLQKTLLETSNEIMQLRGEISELHVSQY